MPFSRFVVVALVILGCFGCPGWADSSPGIWPTPNQILSIKTWDGGGTTDEWTDGDNWDPNGAPGSSDTVIFDGTATKDASINTDVTVAGLNIQTGYSGTITQGSSALTVNGDFSQAGGTFTGGSATIDVNGSFALSGGAFTSTSGELQAAGNFSHTGGSFAHHNGTMRVNGGTGTQTISGTTTFYNLTLDNGGATTDLGTSSTTIARELAADGGTMDAGTSTITFSGAAGLISGSNSKRFYDLVIAGGASISNASGGTLYIQHDFTNDGTFEQASGQKTIFDNTSTIHNLSGTGITTFGEIQVTGSTTLNASSHAFIVTGATFQVTGTFNGDSATVFFDGTTNLNGSGDYNFNNLTVNSNATAELSASNPPTVSGTLTNNGTLSETQMVSNTTVSFLSITDGSGTDKYFGVEIDTTNNLGSTTVAVSGNQTCSQTNGFPVKRCYEITPNAQASANVKFYFRNAELQTGQTLDSLNVWHYNSSAWDPQTKGDTGTDSGGVSTTCGAGAIDCFVQGTGITSYSPFALKNNDPLAVTISSLTATPAGDHVLLSWETVSELDNLGFNLYRATAPDGRRTQLNATLIPSQAPGSGRGASYTYRDDTVHRGVTYWYWLEDVDLSGLRTLHGPASTTIPPYRAFLPLTLLNRRP